MISLVRVPLHERPEVLAAVFCRCRQGSKVTAHTEGAAQSTPAFSFYLSITVPPRTSLTVPMVKSEVIYSLNSFDLAIQHF